MFDLMKDRYDVPECVWHTSREPYTAYRLCLVLKGLLRLARSQERYTRDPEPFDWYQRWAGLKDTFSEFAQPSNAILMLGCGNSRLSEACFNYEI